MARKRKTEASQKPIEQYEHKDKQRLNNPPVGLVDARTDNGGLKKKKYQYDPHLDPQLQWDNKRNVVEKIIDDGLSANDIKEAKSALKQLKDLQEPFLNWAGKSEHTSFEIPTVSLHVHERIDPRKIIETVRKEKEGESQPSLFETNKKPLREAIEFYKHKENWSNRLVAGDSLLVMNSLLEKEGMGGKVQMVYFDPPYGIKYGSNFQPFVNKRDVKDGKDEDLTAEPEMIKAFRDTWELGIHSYLTYLRDRLLLARELLHESGSVFVQISDENVHLFRGILDEVFGKENFVVSIILKKTGSHSGDFIEPINDFILWYTKTKDNTKTRKLFEKRVWTKNETDGFNDYEDEKGDIKKIDDDFDFQKHQLVRADPILSSGHRETTSCKIQLGGKVYDSGHNYNWKVHPEGIVTLWKKKRIIEKGTNIYYKRYYSDFPVKGRTNIWDLGGASNLIYVVQTNTEAVQRCILMTTAPGDLVLDITCGSGTTAFVAENWGRRWITCDTSRVAVTLAKQRLMTASFDYYELAHPNEGVGSGFKYKTVPHITLKSIANNEPPGQETLYDQPFIDNKRQRVTGPFTVEAVPAPVARSFEEFENPPQSPFAKGGSEQGGKKHTPSPLAGESWGEGADSSVARTGETLRQSNWRDELLRAGVRAKGGKLIEFTRVETARGFRYVQAEAETKEDKPKKVYVVFGPEHAPLEQRMVELAWEEVKPYKPDILLFCALQFDEEAAKDIDEMNPEITKTVFLKAQMNADLLTDDLKKKRSSNESFWLIGQPDVTLRPVIASGARQSKKDSSAKPQNDKQYVVEVLGFDYYNPKTGTVESGGKGDIAMWMLDTDYDGRSLFPSQVFFPMASDKEGWVTLSKNLKAEIDEEKIEAFRGTVSLPFTPGKAVAVKIIDARGIESLKIIRGI